MNTKASFLNLGNTTEDVNSDCNSSFFLECASLDETDTFDDIDETFFSRPVSPIDPLQQTTKQQPVMRKPSMISNLSLSFKRFKISTSNLLYSADEKIFSNQPRLTDDRLPTNSQYQEQELTTFKIITPLPNSNNSTVHKSRESRINPEFLKLYAFETSARLNGLLENVDHIENASNIDLDRLSDQQLAFSLKVREKLWNKVVLPPREDILPSLSFASSEYVKLAPSSQSSSQTEDLQSSILENNSSADGLKVKPWLQLRDLIDNPTKSIKPKGYLNEKTQFTVKGWANKKWIPIQETA